VSASDYTYYDAVVPTDPRLPNSGQVITGVPDLNPDKLGLSRNVVKDDSQFGDTSSHYDGYDVTANGRSATCFPGGISSGRRLTDVCAGPHAGAESSFLTITGQATPVSFPFCRVSEPMQNNFKRTPRNGLPWYGIRVSGRSRRHWSDHQRLQHVRGQRRPGLGRPFSSGSSTVNLVPGWLMRLGCRVFRTAPSSVTASTIRPALHEIFNVGKGRVV
jgi:hypothetical protein